MNYESMIKHINEDHKDAITDVCKKFAGVDKINDVYVESIDLEGIDFVYDNKKLRVEFPQKATQETLKDTIVELCQSVPRTHDICAVRKDMNDFKDSCNSVCLATLGKNGDVIASYAPYINYKGKNYIYISEVSDHFDAVKSNPSNIDIMFLQDEGKAKSVIVRMRLRHRARASFIERDSDEFNGAFDEFERVTGGSGGIKTIRKMLDFHLVKLEFGKGRFVKGFGQAYDIDESGNITFAGGSGMPHKMPHKQQ